MLLYSFVTSARPALSKRTCCIRVRVACEQGTVVIGRCSSLSLLISSNWSKATCRMVSPYLIGWSDMLLRHMWSRCITRILSLYAGICLGFVTCVLFLLFWALSTNQCPHIDSRQLNTVTPSVLCYVLRLSQMHLFYGCLICGISQVLDVVRRLVASLNKTGSTYDVCHVQFHCHSQYYCVLSMLRHHASLIGIISSCVYIWLICIWPHQTFLACICIAQALDWRKLREATLVFLLLAVSSCVLLLILRAAFSEVLICHTCSLAGCCVLIASMLLLCGVSRLCANMTALTYLGTCSTKLDKIQHLFPRITALVHFIDT